MNIKYIGSWADYSGYGEANRNIIHALYLAGINITTEKMEFVNDKPVYGEGFKIALRQENAQLPYDIKIIHLTPNLYLKHLEPLKYHILGNRSDSPRMGLELQSAGRNLDWFGIYKTSVIKIRSKSSNLYFSPTH
jgi:hypothetical protein